MQLGDRRKGTASQAVASKQQAKREAAVCGRTRKRMGTHALEACRSRVDEDARDVEMKRGERKAGRRRQMDDNWRQNEKRSVNACLMCFEAMDIERNTRAN